MPLPAKDMHVLIPEPVKMLDYAAKKDFTGVIQLTVLREEMILIIRVGPM